MNSSDLLKLTPFDQNPLCFMNQVKEQGGTEFHARKILSYYLNRSSSSVIPAIPKSILKYVEEPLELKLERVAESSTDSFRKLVFRTSDDLRVETVLIPLHKTDTMSVCISSQVGCVMGCVFCATARMPKRRNLKTCEIIDQFLQARGYAQQLGKTVRSVVFMGMGEPFLNYDQVLNAAELICFPIKNAISAESITISTVGLKHEIERFTQEKRRFRLSVSLGAATDEKRSKLVPIAARTRLADLIQAIRGYTQSRKQRINISYVCISGENVSIDDAKAIGELFSDIPVRLDLIDVTDATGKYKPPTVAELNEFRDALRVYLKQPVARRYSGGADIQAACGTLAGEECT